MLTRARATQAEQRADMNRHISPHSKKPAPNAAVSLNQSTNHVINSC